MGTNHRGPGKITTAIDRRKLLAAFGGVLAAGLAGCSGVTSREFVASPVRVSDAGREELGLAEIFTDSQTTTIERTISDQDVRATITNQVAGYGRPASTQMGAVWGDAKPTLVERFAGIGREVTPGSGAAINAVASEFGIEAVNPEFVEGDTPIPGSRVTFVVPEWARHDGEVRLDDLMVLHHAEALPVDELTSRGGNNYLVDLRQVLPDREAFPSAWSDWTPSERWVAGHEGHWIPENPNALRCVVCLGESSPTEVFGLDEMPGRRLADGETISTVDTLVFAPAPKEDPGPAFPLEPARVFDAGYPTPTGVFGYGLGVIATPNAEILDQSVNPLTLMDTEDLLTSDQAKNTLAEAGLTDADEVEWLRDPERIPGQEWLPVDSASVLDEEVALEAYGGIVSGQAGPWAVAIHFAKATPDDVVIAAAFHGRPVGTPDGRELFGDGSGFIDRRWTVRASELTQGVFASLEVPPEEA